MWDVLFDHVTPKVKDSDRADRIASLMLSRAIAPGIVGSKEITILDFVARTYMPERSTEYLMHLNAPEWPVQPSGGIVTIYYDRTRDELLFAGADFPWPYNSKTKVRVWP